MVEVAFLLGILRFTGCKNVVLRWLLLHFRGHSEVLMCMFFGAENFPLFPDLFLVAGRFAALIPENQQEQ